MEQRPTVSDEEIEIIRAYGKGRDVDVGKKTLIIYLIAEESVVINVGKKISKKRCKEGSGSMEMDEQRNEATQDKVRR